MVHDKETTTILNRYGLADLKNEEITSLIHDLKKISINANTGEECDSTSKSAVNVHVSNHPLLAHKVSILRSSSTIPHAFRSVLREITFHLGYEAMSSLTTRPVNITVPNSTDHVSFVGKKISERITLIPILRSGLGMSDAMLELVPNAGVHHIGMYKSHNMPVQYYNRLPKICEYDVAFVIDPVMATAQTMMSVLGIMKKWGVPKIHVVTVIASKIAIKTISEAHPDIKITVGEIDDAIDDAGCLLPGLGDAGDRIFGTHVEDNEEALMHVSKRKKSI
mmetsp:Transcript_52284/g.61045  ORF Transcript_52284/g.61045 Transcript_52284/m.61045 type:complete len:279 (+) Transcript_52284:37-873(+)